ncbi:MAG: SurA N-terminal domain-containing protein [Labilithrix sp.]|nr:SurA N-terminal domain-containing protein [Labilithrix sp.]
MNLTLRSAIASLGVIAATSATRPAVAEGRAPIPLDGVAAVVGEERIFRSDVTARARPFLDRLTKDPVKRRGELVDLHKQVLMRLVDETLIAKDAAKLDIKVSDGDVADGIARVAEQNKMDRKALEAEVRRAGMTKTDYEYEIRRQILEGRWLVARAGGKIDRKLASDPDAYQKALEEQRELLLVELRSRVYIEVR